MPTETITDVAAAATQISAFERFLNSENDVLRSAAIQALPSLDMPRENLRSTLIEFLLDEDPDVRSDAMEALVPLALPDDAAIIRRSLQGDPVREVKLAAIAALVRMKDAEAVPLLRSLATSRSDDQVAWEDDGSDWEDWLDIQTAAIGALGEMQVEDAIGDLIDALFDEYGQSVDIPVLAAFGRMGDHGISVLIETFRQTKGATRRRAAAALSDISPEALQPHIGNLLDAEEKQLRLLGLDALCPEDSRGETLARTDPDPDVRAAALDRASAAFPELARQCLSDANDVVKAATLRNLVPPFDPEFHEALIENLLLWLPESSPELGKAIVQKLCDLAPNRALGPLLSILDTPERDLELRVTAARGLGVADLKTPTAAIAERLSNPARQVRTALLTVLRQRIDMDKVALEIVCSAIAGTLGLSGTKDTDDQHEELAKDFGTPKEGSGPSRIWITPEGEFVNRSDIEVQDDNSTLNAILVGSQVSDPPMAEDTPEESGAKRAKRRPVEGSGDIAASLTCDALAISADHDDARLTEAILHRTEDPDDTIRRSAWHALARCSISTEHLDKVDAAFRQSDPIIRMSAFHILCAHKRADAIAAALNDDDALIRAEAVQSLPVDTIVDFVADAASNVRQAAAECILSEGHEKHIIDAINRAVEAERSDVVKILADCSEVGKPHSISKLAASAGNDRQALVIMRGLV